jgi:hypothetical protein
VVLANNMDAVDWDRLRRKAALERRQLDQMVDFAVIPDRLKHTALEHYFNTGALLKEDELKLREAEEGED